MPITQMITEFELQHRKLTDGEKRILTYLNDSENSRRESTLLAQIRLNPFRLDGAKLALICDPLELISLVGKNFIKIKYGVVTLNLRATDRSFHALRKDGFFDNESLDGFLVDE